MKIRRFILAMGCIIYSLACFPENKGPDGKVDTSLNLKLSYNSSLIYPGGRLGIEFPVKSFISTRMKKSGKEKELIKDRFIALNLSWYHHPSFHDNLYMTAGWTMRRTRKSGFFTEFSPEMGVSRTFIGGTTYRVDDSGNVSLEKFAGYFYALVSVGGGIGYDFSITHSKPIMVFYKLNLLSMYPYNSTIYLRPAMEIGLTWKLCGIHLTKKWRKT